MAFEMTGGADHEKKDLSLMFHIISGRPSVWPTMRPETL